MIPMKTLFLLLAHYLYDSACCGGKDCHPVACEEIHQTVDGWEWRHEIKFTRSQMKLSADGNCHVCVAKPEWSGAPPYGTCIYLPPET